MIKRPRQIALRTALIYLAAGVLWILFSDALISTFTNDTATLTRLQTYKGWLFVGTTAILLWYTLRKPLLRLIEESERRRVAERELIKINKELEERVKERTARYREANREMEAFIHSVSHELRSPLRSLGAWTRILGEDHREGLDEEAESIMTEISHSVSVMKELIEDLHSLAYSSKVSIKYNNINMKAMAEAICHETTLRRGDNNCHFVVGDMPHAMGDNNLIKQVWINLIDNAVKFSSNSKKPEVIIKGRREGTDLVYCVNDNGTGFNEEHYDKLFLVFSRLHRRDEFAGTGVGLSIVKRIVNRHEGRVWAKSGGKGKSKGATFCFAIPYRTED